MTKIKLTTYVEGVVKEYDIPDTRVRNIRTMFVKHLQKTNLWDNADQANDICKSKIFDPKDLDTIKQRLHNYLQENNKEATKIIKTKRKKRGKIYEIFKLTFNFIYNRGSTCD